MDNDRDEGDLGGKKRARSSKDLQVLFDMTKHHTGYNMMKKRAMAGVRNQRT